MTTSNNVFQGSKPHKPSCFRMFRRSGESACLVAILLGLSFLNISCDSVKSRIMPVKEEAAAHDHGADAHGADAHDASGGGHTHGASGEKSSRITCWSAGYEVFIEHAFVVANKPTQFTTHLTYAATGKPRETGPAVFILQCGSDAPIEMREDKPARTGIYLPQLVFPKAGDWKVLIRTTEEQGESSIELPTIRAFESDEAVTKAPEEAAPEGISFLKEQQWKVFTQTIPVERRDLTQRARVTGTVSACPGHTATLAPPVSGMLTPVAGENLPFVGDIVEANAVCAVVQLPSAASETLSYESNQTQIRNLRLELTAEIAKAESASHQAQVAVEQAQVALKRTEDLFQKKARSQRELEEAQYSLRRAQAEQEASGRICTSLRSALKQSGAGSDQPLVEMRSPIAGRIVEARFHAGEYARSDQPAFTIVDSSTVLITARAPESLLPKLGDPQNALYEIPGIPGQYRPIDGASGGRLVSMTGIIDPETRTLPITYEVPNADGALHIGMSVTAHIQTGRKEKTLSIPESSIVDEAGRPAAYVMVSGETFAKRELTLGIRDGDHVEVLSGINEGDHIVVSGAYAIRLAALSTAIPAHGHVH